MKIDISKLSTYNAKILTDTGYECIEETFVKREECLEFHLDNWEIITVAKNHLFEIADNLWKYAEQFDVGECLMTKDGISEVINIIDVGEQDVYDMTVGTEKHQYYANGVSSHNSGKTLLALSAGMKMIRQGKYDKIIYIRNSVESVDKAEEVGFLPGLEEKFKIYNYPLFDTLEFIAQKDMRKKENNQSQESIDSKVEELIAKYHIETVWNGSIRGRTISNAFVIIDEVQNFAKSSLHTVLSRMDKDSKVVCIGSNRQIDHPYINKYTNGLSVLIGAAKESNNEVNLFGTELDKVVRGKITEFAERIFEKK